MPICCGELAAFRQPANSVELNERVLATTRLALKSEGFRPPRQADQALSELLALVEAMQDRAHEWNAAENRNLQTVW